MATYWKHRTNKGRIVYENAFKPITCGPVLRMLAALAKRSFYGDPESFECWMKILHKTVTVMDGIRPENYKRYMNDVVKVVAGEKPTFGEGEFGGGGATREDF